MSGDRLGETLCLGEQREFRMERWRPAAVAARGTLGLLPWGVMRVAGRRGVSQFLAYNNACLQRGSSSLVQRLSWSPAPSHCPSLLPSRCLDTEVPSWECPSGLQPSPLQPARCPRVPADGWWGSAPGAQPRLRQTCLWPLGAPEYSRFSRASQG